MTVTRKTLEITTPFVSCEIGLLTVVVENCQQIPENGTRVTLICEYSQPCVMNVPHPDPVEWEVDNEDRLQDL